MAKGDPLSHHQQGIVRRYYEHLDTLTLQKLGELVSELYLAPNPTAADKLWKRAETALRRLGVPDPALRSLLTARNPQALAELLTKLSRSAR